MNARGALSGWLEGSLALLLLGGAAGCGWHTGLVVPDGVHTVGIEYFDNVTPEPGVELDLAREVARAVVDLVDVRLVSAHDADVVIVGVVRTFKRRQGIRTRENGLLETGVRIEASASLLRRSNGEELAASRASIWSGFSTDLPENDLLARERAIRKISDELVLELFTPRAYQELEADPGEDLAEEASE